MQDNWFFIIPILFFGYLAYLSIKNRKITYYDVNSSNYKIIINYLPLTVIGFYLLSAILIFFVDTEKWYPYFHKDSYTFINFLIYSVFLCIYLYPVLYIKPIISENLVERSKFITFIMFVMSILGLFSIIYQFPYALKGLVIGAADLRLQMNIDNSFLLPKSPLTTLAVGISYFYLFYIAFFFISIIQNRHWFIKVSLFIGSISYIISGLAFTARDVFIFYGIGFLFVFLYFKNILSLNIQKTIKRIFIISGSVLVVLMLLITFQRFNNKHHDIAYGTIGYIAQQPFVFSETISYQNNFDYGDRRFPLFKSFFAPVKEKRLIEPYEWSFGTFIKDFYSVNGYSFLIIITLIIVPIFHFRLKKSYKGNFYRNLIVILFYFQFTSTGLFYYKIGANAGNIYIILLLILYIMTFFTFNKKEGKQIC